MQQASMTNFLTHHLDNGAPSSKPVQLYKLVKYDATDCRQTNQIGYTNKINKNNLSGIEIFS